MATHKYHFYLLYFMMKLKPHTVAAVPDFGPYCLHPLELYFHKSIRYPDR